MDSLNRRRNPSSSYSSNGFKRCRTVYGLLLLNNADISSSMASTSSSMNSFSMSIILLIDFWTDCAQMESHWQNRQNCIWICQQIWHILLFLFYCVGSAVYHTLFVQMTFHFASISDKKSTTTIALWVIVWFDMRSESKIFTSLPRVLNGVKNRFFD